MRRRQKALRSDEGDTLAREEGGRTCLHRIHLLDAWCQRTGEKASPTAHIEHMCGLIHEQLLQEV
jgi:hypothetical protein